MTFRNVDMSRFRGGVFVECTVKFKLDDEFPVLTMNGVDIVKIIRREVLINLDTGNQNIYYNYRLLNKNTIERDEEDLLIKFNELAQAYEKLEKEN